MQMIIDESNKFIYVMSKKSRDALLAKGYKLLKSDDKTGTYIFENNKKLTFDLSHDKIIDQAVGSNTLTF